MDEPVARRVQPHRDRSMRDLAIAVWSSSSAPPFTTFSTVRTCQQPNQALDGCSDNEPGGQKMRVAVLPLKIVSGGQTGGDRAGLDIALYLALNPL